MFAFPYLSPHMKCYIKDCKLIVERPNGLEDKVIDITPCSFVQDRGAIYDERNVIVTSTYAYWAIGTADGYTVIGTKENVYMVLNPQGYVMCNGKWDTANVRYTVAKIGLHANEKVYRSVFLNEWLPDILQVGGAFNYAICEHSMWLSLLERARKRDEIDPDTALPLYTSNYGEDSYYIEGEPLDTYIVEKKFETYRGKELLHDKDEVQTCNAFWRYGKGGHIYPCNFNYSGSIGPYEIPLFYEKKYSRYRQHIPREYMIQLLQRDDKALAVYCINENTVNLLYEAHISSKTVRILDLGFVDVEKSNGVDIPPLHVKESEFVGYKLTQPLSYGIKPMYERLYQSETGEIMGEPSLYVPEDLEPEPSLILYKQLVLFGKTYAFEQSVTGKPILM